MCPMLNMHPPGKIGIVFITFIERCSLLPGGERQLLVMKCFAAFLRPWPDQGGPMGAERMSQLSWEQLHLKWDHVPGPTPITVSTWP